MTTTVGAVDAAAPAAEGASSRRATAAEAQAVGESSVPPESPPRIRSSRCGALTVPRAACCARFEVGVDPTRTALAGFGRADTALCIDEDPAEAAELLSADAAGAAHDIAAPTPSAIANPPTLPTRRPDLM
ncbi:hypothetical protein [Mycolicibacterium pallens]|uniref:Uncharacterized protein n=1 Tax=Mycolicibacterium pallens TaxID=370524 RepID=A0ABX8VTE1_9MYCO|nr:hypothetical protein [Mycolicibacterium pallens]QYL19411.1 hypothetical protein K0O64_13530 [Mycolicibacterium pallens]